jgi:hypothetical protein
MAGAGYKLEFVAQVKDNFLRGEHGVEAKPAWLRLEGAIQPDGSATLDARGLTGDPKYNIKALFRVFRTPTASPPTSIPIAEPDAGWSSALAICVSRSGDLVSSPNVISFFWCASDFPTSVL